MLDRKQLYIAIGARIKRIREAADMTQGELAHILDLKRTSITNIERGNQRPTLDALYRFCERFTLELSDVLPSVLESTRQDARSVVVGGKAQEVGAKTAIALERLRPAQGSRR
jgi:transcriptional regulator with XRE-family HTH domain